MSIYLKSKAGGGSLPDHYDPRVAPLEAGRFDDEFNDGTISEVWIPTTASYDGNITILHPPDSSNIHLSESLVPGWLLMQGTTASNVVGIYRDISSVSASDSFTVVVRFCTFPGMDSDDHTALGIYGQSDIYYYYLRCGRFNNGSVLRTVFRNGGGTPVQGALLAQVGISYLMIQYTGDGNFHAFASTDGVGWTIAEYSRNLSITGFTKLMLEVGSKYGVVGFDFVRWFDSSGVYIIGRPNSVE